MGGHQHGEVASARVRDALVDLIARGQTLVDAVRGAGEKLLQQTRSNNGALPMGTTVAALRLTEHQYEVAWVGDSRIYLWHNELRRISHDHSLVQTMIAAGVLDESQAARHPQRNVLTQALGITTPEQLHISIARGRIEPGMSFLVCSDGLTEELSDAALADLIGRQELAAQECVDHLLLAALGGAARDNITAVLARIH